MGRVRGLHDINTHGTLARKGKLISVARDWHRWGNRGEPANEELWDGSVERHLYKKRPAAPSGSRQILPILALEEIMRRQAQVIQDDIEELRRFAEERIPGVARELRHLEERLAQLKTE